MNSRVRFSHPPGWLVLVLAALVLAATAGWWDRAPDLRPRLRCRSAAEAVAAHLACGRPLRRLPQRAVVPTTVAGVSSPRRSAAWWRLTSPDPPAAGIGRWTPAAFRRAWAEGRSADGARCCRPVPPELRCHAFGATPMTCSPTCAEAVPPHDLHGVSAWAGRADRVARAARRARPIWRRLRACVPTGRGAYLVGGLATGHCGARHGLRNGAPLAGLGPAGANCRYGAGSRPLLPTRRRACWLDRGRSGRLAARRARRRALVRWPDGRGGGAQHAALDEADARRRRVPAPPAGPCRRADKQLAPQPGLRARSCMSATAPTATAKATDDGPALAATARWRCRRPPT